MITFIIPVYNKGSILFKTLAILIHQLKKNQILDYEIIIVNDGSTDNSLKEAIRFKHFNGETQKIKIHYYQNNVGKGYALRYGFSKSVGDPVVFLDGDMNINASFVLKALRVYKQFQPDMVIGSKYLPSSRTHYPFVRYLYSIILKFTITALFHLRVSDTQVGLKVFRRNVLENTLPKLVIKQFASDLELLIVASLLHYDKIFELPVVIKHSSANKSSIGMLAVKNFCQDILALFYRRYIIHYYNQPLQMPDPASSVLIQPATPLL